MLSLPAPREATALLGNRSGAIALLGKRVSGATTMLATSS